MSEKNSRISYKDFINEKMPMFDQIRIVISHWPMLPRLVRSLLPSWPPATRKLSSLSSSSLGTRDLRLRRPGELGTWASEVRARSGPAPGPLNEPPRPRRAVRGVLSGVWLMLSSSVRGEYCENNAKNLWKKWVLSQAKFWHLSAIVW